MTGFRCDHLFRPQSVAVVGASDRSHSVGRTVMSNLLAGGFGGPVLPVNPKYSAVCGVLAYRDVRELPVAPELAVVCTPPAAVPDVVEALGAKGTRAVAVLTAGLERRAEGPSGCCQERTLAAARRHAMRVLGPNCLGLISTAVGLNATFAAGQALQGDVAFVTQSGAIGAAALDWAASRGVGFSRFVSLGNCADLGFADFLEYLADDDATRAILLYIEGITAPRRFMAAAQRASRKKPVVAVKAGRVREGASAATSHTGALAGADDVYEAALRRAGILRVDTVEAVFNAVETLTRTQPWRGERLAILTNGGGPGVMAVDALIRRGGVLARLSAKTLNQLNAVLPKSWSHGNPIDILGDASAERYATALQALAADPGVDAILVLHAPTALVRGEEVACRMTPLIRHMEQPAFTCWMGGNVAASARRWLAEQRVPTYESPEDAVQAMLQQAASNRLQTVSHDDELLSEFRPVVDTDAARRVVHAALEQQRSWLTEPEAKQLLSHFGVPVTATETAASPASAGEAADRIGYPVVVKVLSPDIIHKSDVGGVALDLTCRTAVVDACRRMINQIAIARPTARIDGFTVQAMVSRPGAIELIVGINNDSTFGPVVLIGHGGVAAEVVADRALDLPPLNARLAREMLAKTRVARLLRGYRNRPPADEQAIVAVLLRIAQLATELPEVAELDVNPLLADESGVVALDARVRVQQAELNVPPAIGRTRLQRSPQAAV